jgi:hypothetical protein
LFWAADCETDSYLLLAEVKGRLATKKKKQMSCGKGEAQESE